MSYSEVHPYIEKMGNIYVYQIPNTLLIREFYSYYSTKQFTYSILSFMLHFRPTLWHKPPQGLPIFLFLPHPESQYWAILSSNRHFEQPPFLVYPRRVHFRHPFLPLVLTASNVAVYFIFILRKLCIVSL